VLIVTAEFRDSLSDCYKPLIKYVHSKGTPAMIHFSLPQFLLPLASSSLPIFSKQLFGFITRLFSRQSKYQAGLRNVRIGGELIVFGLFKASGYFDYNSASQAVHQPRRRSRTHR
jgi:hypothetical protein